MELDEAIKGRRSIRSFLDKEVPEVLVRQVLEAAIWAPSAKNEQQWRFTVLAKEAKRTFVEMFRRNLEELSKRIGRQNMCSSFGSCHIMEQAPVLIIVWNAGGRGWETEIHSVAAAVQNMLLKAYASGLGSLWIGDIFYSYEAILKHFGKPWKLIAALSLGWPAHSPQPKARRSVDEVAEFLT